MNYNIISYSITNLLVSWMYSLAITHIVSEICSDQLQKYIIFLLGINPFYWEFHKSNYFMHKHNVT